MLKNKIIIDASDELLIQIEDNAVRLVRPDKTKYLNTQNNLFNISKLLNLPLNIGYLDTENVIRNINENTIKIAGYLSKADTLGKTVRIAAKKDAADFSINHDRLVTQNCRPLFR